MSNTYHQHHPTNIQAASKKVSKAQALAQANKQYQQRLEAGNQRKNQLYREGRDLAFATVVDQQEMQEKQEEFEAEHSLTNLTKAEIALIINAANKTEEANVEKNQQILEEELKEDKEDKEEELEEEREKTYINALDKALNLNSCEENEALIGNQLHSPQIKTELQYDLKTEHAGYKQKLSLKPIRVGGEPTYESYGLQTLKPGESTGYYPTMITPHPNHPTQPSKENIELFDQIDGDLDRAIGRADNQSYQGVLIDIQDEVKLSKARFMQAENVGKREAVFHQMVHNIAVLVANFNLPPKAKQAIDGIINEAVSIFGGGLAQGIIVQEDGQGMGLGNRAPTFFKHPDVTVTPGSFEQQIENSDHKTEQNNNNRPNPF